MRYFLFAATLFSLTQGFCGPSYNSFINMLRCPACGEVYCSDIEVHVCEVNNPEPESPPE